MLSHLPSVYATLNNIQGARVRRPPQSMRLQTLIFILASFGFLTLSRVLLAVWQWERVQAAGGLWPILRGGVRIDATQVAMLAALPALLAPWVGHYSAASIITEGWLLLSWLLLVLLEASTPQFIREYDTRPNRLYVDYLKHPKEVLGMLWRGYKFTLGAAVALITVAAWAGVQLFEHIGADQPLQGWLPAIYTGVMAPILFFVIRGTWSHRPINPSTVAYCGDGMLNTLPLNSLYNVLYAIYSIKNERSASDVYGRLADHEIRDEVNRCAGITPTSDHIPSLHRPTPIFKPIKPLNIVIIVEESLGAQYVGNLGGQA